jgi:predicted AlkP superfamily pyrophosphatase or phosphodiesterase
MIRPLVLCLALLLGSCAHAAAEPPRLVLVIVVDQMRADYLDRFAFTKGFAQLKSEGAVFTHAFHGHVPTETCPGHSVILTGQFPNVTGIVGNEWYDRVTRTKITCMTDAVHGLGPQNLLAYTIGDALKARDPSAKVAAVSLKDRAAIPLGGKRADLALWYDKDSGRVATSSYYGASPPWIADLALKPSIRAEPAGDELVLEMATRVLAHLPLGKDDVPDLLGVSFSSPDYVGHTFGIDGPQLAQQYAALDDVLQRLIARAEAQAGKGRLLVALTADHGVVPAPEDPSAAGLNVHRYPIDAFQNELEARLQKIAPTQGRPWIVTNELPNLYLDRELARARKLDWTDFLRQAARAARELPGVASVYTGETAGDDDAVRRGYFPGRSGDLIVIPASGAFFSEHPTGTTHGSPYDYDAHVPLILWGPAFKPGTYPEHVWVASLAPTLARVLGLSWTPAAEAPAVTSALAAPR